MAKSPNPTDKHVGSMVRMRRLMLGMSQGKLADALGITFQQVQKYEKGANRISASRLQQTADILQVPILFFFDGLTAPSHSAKQPHGPTVPPDVSAFLATSDGLSLVRAYSQIKKRTLKRAIVNLVEELAGQ